MLRYLEKITHKCKSLSVSPTVDCVFVSISEQRLYHFTHGRLTRGYAISTSRKAPSCEENSLGTPTGLHRVAQKIGTNAPQGMVFKGRQPTGQRFWEYPDNVDNLITTRILWLTGLEKGHNTGDGIDTFNRYIYIHGTNQENALGTPNSHGCILLSNADILELYGAIPEGTCVLVE